MVKARKHKPVTIGAGLTMTIITDQQGEATAVQLRVDLYGGFIREIVVAAEDMDAFAEAWQRERLRVMPSTNLDAAKG